MTNLIAQHSIDHYQGAYLAATYGHPDLLQHIYQSKSLHLALYNLQNVSTIYSALIRASENNHHHVMQWFERVGIIDNWIRPHRIYNHPLDNNERHNICEPIIIHASRTGNLVLLEHLRYLDDKFHLCWETVLIAAFENNQIAVLDWILAIVATKFPAKISHHRSIDLYLPTNTNLTHLFAWFLANQQKLPVLFVLRFEQIILPTQTDILEHVYLHSCIAYPYRIMSVFFDTVRSGSLDAVQWLYQRNKSYFISNIGNITKLIVQFHHPHLFAWVIETRGHPTDPVRIVSTAIRYGNILILEWCLKNKIDITLSIKDIEICATMGYVHVLAWLRDHNLLAVQYDTSLMMKAIESGQIYLLKWLGKDRLANQSTANKLYCLKTVTKRGHVSILDLYIEYELVNPSLITESFHQLEVRPTDTDMYPMVKWFIEQEPNFSLHIILADAINRDEWHIVRWIRENRPDTKTTALSDKQLKKVDRYLDFSCIPCKKCMIYASDYKS